MFGLTSIVAKILRKPTVPLAGLLLFGMIPLTMPATAQTAISIGTAKDPNLGSQIVIARDKGFFKEAGLDVTINYFPSGGDLMAATVGGSVQMGSSGATPAITLRARPYPIKVLSQISDISDAQQIIVNSSITSPDALYGKKIALMKNTSSQALFEAFAKAYGFDANKVQVTYMAPTEMLSSFSRGDVDAISLWEPFTTRARNLFKGKTFVTGTQSYIPGHVGERRIYGDHAVLFSSETFVSEHPATVKAVLTALARSDDYIQKHKSEASDILAKEFGIVPEDMAHIMTENRYTVAIDDQMADDIDRLTDFLYNQKNIQSKPTARSWIDPSFLREVRPQLVTLK
jgi:ABC-type nitrate/sulfonate/bicarbonate transport system substrate-binding protein